METLYLLFYWSIQLIVLFYVSAMAIAIVASVFIITRAESWEVDTKNPLSKRNAIIRKVEPYEIIVLTKGGKPKFPIIDMNEKRLTVEGLINSNGELDNEKPGQWKIKQLALEERDKNGNILPYPEIIQSKWGWLSPLFLFRKMVFTFTQRHVVRVMFPFFITGFYELYSPHIMTFVRAHAKGDSKEKVERGTMVVLDDVYESQYHMVQDKTDHLLYISPIRFITNKMPTRDGFSLRADVTILVKVVDLFQIVSMKDWSKQMVSAIDNALSSVFRTGGLDTVYAVGDVSKTNHIQDAVETQLTSRGRVVKDVSLMEYLGFEFMGITLNNLIPADEHTKKEIVRIMAILTEGRKTAEAAGMLLNKQVEELKGADSDLRSAIASITAAQKSSGKIDWIMNQSGGSSNNSETDKAILAFLKRIENKK